MKSRGGWRDATRRDVSTHKACSRDAFVVWYLKPRRYWTHRSERFWEEPLGVSNDTETQTVSVCESTPNKTPNTEMKTVH